MPVGCRQERHFRRTVLVSNNAIGGHATLTLVQGPNVSPCPKTVLTELTLSLWQREHDVVATIGGARSHGERDFCKQL